MIRYRVVMMIIVMAIEMLVMAPPLDSSVKSDSLLLVHGVILLILLTHLLHLSYKHHHLEINFNTLLTECCDGKHIE